MSGAADSADARRQVLLMLAEAAWRYRARASAAVLLLVASKLAFVAVPWLLKRIVDQFSRPEQVLILPAFLLLGYAALRFAGTLFGELRDVVFSRVTQDTVRGFTLRAFEHLHRLGPRFHVLRQTGGLIRDVERGTGGIGFLLGVALFTILPTLVEIGAVLAVMLSSYSLVFTGIIALTFVSYIAVTLWLAGRRVPLVRRLNELDSGANTRLVDSLLNYETVKAHANERFEAQRLEAIMADWTQIGVKNQKALSLLHVGQSGVIALGVAAVMLYTGQEVVNGRLSVGDLVLINAYILQVCLPLNALGFVFREARDAMINVERLFKLMAQRPEIDDRAELPALKSGKGEVRFEHVEFCYEPSRRVLSDVDFKIAPGGRLAVVGGSGSGKSTLARLLLRFYETNGGRILIDGQDIRGVTQKSLRQAIGIVPQDTILFNDTIAYNIAYGRVGASLADVIEAAKSAHVHDFIANLPEQYETRVGERGLKLSGGEKQRVAIARAILKNPPILIFDEATSALDTRSERAIQTELDRISRDRTTLIIAHRLSTIVGADEILVLEHGRVVERGRHAELLGLNGVYAQMWSLQQQQRALERTERRLALQPVNLATLAAGVVDGLRPLIEARGIRLYTSLGIEDARVTGDPSLLHRAIWELCANAVDLTPEGGRVELRVARVGPQAQVVIADSRRLGAEFAPLPEEDRAADAPLDPLSIRSIVEQHQGRFEIIGAAANEGTRYVIELPLRAIATAAPPPLPAPAPDADPRSLEALRVMTIDDEADAREVLVAVLESHGAQVVAESSGHGALERLARTSREQWPQVLICDISLGHNESGYDVLRALRALEAQRHARLDERLPAIALTGYAASEDRMRALLAGFQIHLAKPVNPDELVATVAALAVRPRGAAAA